MRTLRLLLLALLACSLFFFACADDEVTRVPQGGIALVIGTDLKTPDDLDEFQLQIQQETNDAGALAYTSRLDQAFRIPAEVTLPATFTIGAGESNDQNAYIRVIGRRKGVPIVLREVKIEVPTTRVAELKMILSTSCYAQLEAVATAAIAKSSCDEVDESCQPTTGKCGATKVDVTSLPTFDAAHSLEAGALPIIGLDGGGSTTPDASDGGADTGAPDANDGAPQGPTITSFAIAESGGGNAVGTVGASTITVLLTKPSDLKGLVPTIAIDGTTVTPASGTAQDFDNGPVNYTVESPRGSKTYAVSVERPFYPAPTFSPAGGSYTGTQGVFVTTAQLDAQVFYTLDGTSPALSKDYVSGTASITIDRTSTLKTLIKATNYQPTSPPDQNYVISSTVNFDQPAGTYNNGITVHLTSNPSNARRCYRVDATAECKPEPNPDGDCNTGTSEYVDGTGIALDPITGSGSATLHAVGCRAGLTVGGRAVTYAFKVADATFTPPSGEVAAGTQITIATVTQAIPSHPLHFYVSLNATPPDCSGTNGILLNGPSKTWTISSPTMLQVIGCRDGYSDSEIVTASYTVK